MIEGLAQVLPDGGLVRGRTVSCTGAAGVSLALALVARATEAGSWLALVGVPWVGIEAARELGVALDRTVSVDADPDVPGVWGERVAAATDGFDLIVTSLPPRAPDRLARQLRQRLQSRGGVLVDVSGAGPASARPGSVPAPSGADLTLATAGTVWEGVGWGHGHLRCRRFTLTVTGRRVPRPVRADCWLPGPSGGFDLVSVTSVAFVGAGER